MSESRRHPPSRIWKRFVLHFTTVAVLFLVAVVAVIWSVGLPVATAKARNALASELLDRQQGFLDEFGREAAVSPAVDPLLDRVLTRHRAAIVEDRESLARLDELTMSERTPATTVEIDSELTGLNLRLDSLFDSSSYAAVLRGLHGKMVIILLVVFACIGGTMFIFVRDVVHPLEGLLVTSRRVADGDLSVTFPERPNVKQRDEIDDLAGVLNGLLADFQEAFLLIGSLREETQEQLTKMVPRLDDVGDDDARQVLSSSCAEVLAAQDEIQRIVSAFDFYRSRDEAAGAESACPPAEVELPEGVSPRSATSPTELGDGFEAEVVSRARRS